MRPIRSLLVPLAALVVIGAACSGTDDDAATPTTTAPPGDASAAGEDAAAGTASSLYVATADGGTLADGTLTLTDIDSEVTSFTDRPYRDVAAESVDELVERWADAGFTDDPPNAALVTVGDSGHDTTVVELGEPTLEGTTLTFPVTVLDEGSGALASTPSGGHDGELSQPALFIDDGAQGQMTFWMIEGTWGGGNSTVTFDDATTTASCSFPCGTIMQMDAPGEVQFTAAGKEFGFLQAIDGPVAGPVQASVMSFGLVSGDSLTGTASLASGSDLRIGAQGSNGPTQALESGSFSVPLGD